MWYNFVMKKWLLLLVLLFSINSVFADVLTYSDNGKFGLKTNDGNIVTKAKYKKLIRLGEKAWIAQDGSKFGIIDDFGEILIEHKYTRADRVLGKFAKLGYSDRYGLFDENGFTLLPVEYSTIDLLFGGMFLTCKKYKYGIVDFNGQLILENIFDDIYMPNPNKMILVYNGMQYEVARQIDIDNAFNLTMEEFVTDDESTLSHIIAKPVVSTGYYGITATNYCLKLLTSISPAYEQTIDELMFSQGADAADTIMKFTWLPKFPVVYVKKYYQNLTAPNNGPLSNVKTNLKRALHQGEE